MKMYPQQPRIAPLSPSDRHRADKRGLSRKERLAQQLGTYKVTPSVSYRPTPKAPSRRDIHRMHVAELKARS